MNCHRNAEIVTFKASVTGAFRRLRQSSIVAVCHFFSQFQQDGFNAKIAAPVLQYRTSSRIYGPRTSTNALKIDFCQESYSGRFFGIRVATGHGHGINAILENSLHVGVANKMKVSLVSNRNGNLNRYLTTFAGEELKLSYRRTLIGPRIVPFQRERVISSDSSKP